MKYGDWIDREKLSHAEAGTLIGKSQAAVSRYVAGLRMPDEATLIKIFETSKGEVTPNDFVALPDLSTADAGDDEKDATTEQVGG